MIFTKESVKKQEAGELSDDDILPDDLFLEYIITYLKKKDDMEFDMKNLAENIKKIRRQENIASKFEHKYEEFRRSTLCDDIDKAINTYYLQRFIVKGYEELKQRTRKRIDFSSPLFWFVFFAPFFIVILITIYT